MKRAASILLLFLLAFNWVGYRVVSGYLEHNADMALTSKLDRNDYDDASLVEIRVPLNAPYLAQSGSDFERVDGEIELQGVLYKYVKRKVENGELVLLCIPNENKTRILNSRAEFFKLVNDLTHSADSKKQTSSIKPFTTEYQQENNSWNIPVVKLSIVMTGLLNEAFIDKGYHSLPEQPPKA